MYFISLVLISKLSYFFNYFLPLSRFDSFVSHISNAHCSSNFLQILFRFCTAHYSTSYTFSATVYEYIYLIFIFPPPIFSPCSHTLFLCYSPFSLSLLDSWLSNKSFSPVEGAWSTLTWSLWPRNSSSFLLHMVGSLTELLYVTLGPLRSAFIFWPHS